MGKRVSAAEFAAFLIKREKKHDGYIMGATGQNPRNWAIDSWWYNQYIENKKQHAAALKWRETAERVWDCNGLAEGYYKDQTGININTRARYSYRDWCSIKGEGVIPAKYRVPGAALYTGDRAKDIPHVGFLVEPVDKNKPSGDWVVIEARGVSYGVVRSKLSDKRWTFWGLMDKYFDYGSEIEGQQPEAEANTDELGVRILRRGCVGEDVKQAQKLLLNWKADCLPKYGADGDFGREMERAVKAYQADKNLSVDGVIGSATLEALQTEAPEPADVNPYKEPIANVSRGYVGNGVRWVQWELVRHDPKALPKHGIDGDFGKETQTAVKAFQQAKGLQIDGIVGEKTRAALKDA